MVISHLRNEGKGAALRTGFAYALRERYDGVITMDSDGQHDPGAIATLIHAGERQHAAIVLGNHRASWASLPYVRRAVNVSLSTFLSWITRQPIPDSQCGFRFIHKAVLEQIPLRAKRFEIETEVLLKAARGRWKMVSVPVPTIASTGPSHVRPLRDAARLLWLMLSCLVWRSAPRSNRSPH